ncbi:MAG TPA: hypothetical protein IAC47_03480 [Candidatus Onthomorpha intestinigallinarum]|uniref:Outer membrane protein beta-barrel domain-containing protein n=1 Tax=Candidatus Onthomorpha intestinigallinarum TaxID=2840880 RepID=A0A9D1RFT9_9BACT|nr:hypothetical protein [Candidatus Onthomorpha intestinigallinarum]
MKKQLLFIIFLTAFIGSYAQQRHRTASGEPYDIFLSVKPTGGLAQGDFEKNYTYVYGVNMAFEYQLEEIKLGLGFELGYLYGVPQTFKLPFIQSKKNWGAHQMPFTLTANYYFFNERIKPFVGIGLGVIWGRYDYSLSSEESIDEYYLRDFEGQSGWRFGFIPKIGLMISMDHRNGFGIEFSMPYYIPAGRLENQYSINMALNYTFIID